MRSRSRCRSHHAPSVDQRGRFALITLFGVPESLAPILAPQRHRASRIKDGALFTVSAFFVFCLLTRVRTPLNINCAVLSSLPLLVWPIRRILPTPDWTPINLATCALILICLWQALFGSIQWNLAIGDSLLTLGLRALAIQVATRGLNFATGVSLAALATTIASSVLIAATIMVPESTAFRQSLYPEIFADAPPEEALTKLYQGGLAWNTVNMGYQLALTIPLAFALAVAGRHLLYGSALIVLTGGLFLCGQRSALGASSLACLFVTILTWRWFRRVVGSLTTIAVVLVMALVISLSLIGVAEVRTDNLLSKLKDGSSLGEDHRFTVQRWALSEIPFRPFGFLLSGDYERTAPSIDGVTLAPHNHLMTWTLLYGWVPGGLVAAALISCAFRVPALVRAGRRRPGQIVNIAWSAALIAVVLNSFFHNAGVGSRDGPSLLAVFMVLGLYTFAAPHNTALRDLPAPQPAASTV
jgi:hypothetical protein